LAERGIQLTKSLGQNFLHDGNQLRRIVQAAELSRRDKALEIGPGLGPLTDLLMAEAGEVLAIEKDGRFVELLRERLSLEEKGFNPRTFNRSAAPAESPAIGAALTLIHDDALDYLSRQAHDFSDWKVVANLPYCVAAPILVELAKMKDRPSRIVVTLQAEVARRLEAQAGGKDYGVLTLLIQLDYEPRGSFRIPPGCFFPTPEVDSACVVLERRAEALLGLSQRAIFVKIVKRGFSQRRKMMLKLLRADWPEEQLAGAYAMAGIEKTARAESASLEQFVCLTRSLANE